MSRTLQRIQNKVQELPAAQERILAWRQAGEKVVFTNGCFDLLHYGHFHYLAEAADLGDRLVIGLNSSASVARLKGSHRPIQDESTRQTALASLSFVDLVILFEEDTPLKLITALQPDFLVKGGDYRPQDVVGAADVAKAGGAVVVLDFVPGYSTTRIEQKIRGLKS
jgi:D-beta-D-heptose 7-phosphate kinase/D-beta-D-heptose 1-phosphate adenosyltransferase